MFHGVSFGKGERESRQTERAQNRKAKPPKKNLPATYFCPELVLREETELGLLRAPV